MKRREFLKKSITSAAALGLGGVSCMKQGAGNPPIDSGGASGVTTFPHASGLPRRAYGDTGVALSVVGFGGIVVMNVDQAEADRTVAEAIERGVNYFDVAPSYGNAQERLGPALQPYRDRVFLACKTGKRDAAGARQELEESLRVLRTDHLDLYQLHAITDVEKDVDAVFAKGGAWDVIKEARKAGRIRFVGFSAHSEEAALRALELHDFDSVLLPVNFAALLQGHFGPRVIEIVRKRGKAILALKAMARQKWTPNDPHRGEWPKCWYEPISDTDLARLAVRFTLTQPVTALIPPGEARLFRMALDAAAGFTPLTPGETEHLRQVAASLDPVFRSAA